MIKAGMATFDTMDYAFLQTALPKVKCCNFGEIDWTPCYQINDAYIEFIGKGAGKVKLNTSITTEKIEAFNKKYQEYKVKSANVIKSYCG